VAQRTFHSEIDLWPIKGLSPAGIQRVNLEATLSWGQIGWQSTFWEERKGQVTVRDINHSFWSNRQYTYHSETKFFHLGEGKTELARLHHLYQVSSIFSIFIKFVKHTGV
jgi:hypothetical protein